MPVVGSTTVPLPDLPQPLIPPGTDLHDAYQSCKWLEQKTTWGIIANDLDLIGSESSDSRMSPTNAARVLGHALLLAPSQSGREALARDIVACNGEEEWLATVADLYVHGLIRVCTSHRGFYSLSLFSPVFSSLQSQRSYTRRNPRSHPTSVAAGTRRSNAAARPIYTQCARAALVGQDHLPCDNI